MGISNAQTERRRPSLSRRSLLLTAGGITTALLSGCGGKGGGTPEPTPTPSSSPTPPPDSIAAPSFPRTEPTGDLVTQINQHSEFIEQLSAVWIGAAPAQQELLGFLTTRATSLSRGRAASFPNLFVAANGYAFRINIENYDLLLKQYLLFDQINYFGDRLVARNAIRDEALFRNPQWMAAMMVQGMDRIRLIGAIIQFHLLAGMNATLYAIRDEPDTTRQLIAYLLVGDAYNAWLEGLTRAIGVSVIPRWRVELRTGLSSGVILYQLTRIEDAMQEVPFGLGEEVTYSPQGTLRSLGSVRPFFERFVEQFSDVNDGWWKTGNVTISATKISAFISRLPADLVSELRTDTTGTTVEDLCISVLGSVWAALGTELPNQLFNVAFASQDIRTLISASTSMNYLLSSGGLQGSSIVTIFTKIDGLALQVEQKYLAAIAADTVRPTTRVICQCSGKNWHPPKDPPPNPPNNPLQPPGNPKPPGIPGIPIPNPNRVECDVLRNNGVGPSSSPNPPVPPPPPEKARGAYRGPSGSRLVQGRGRLVAEFPRTFDNLEASAYSLFKDFAERNRETVVPTYENGLTKFYSTDFAMLIRRETGSTTTFLPGITDAQLVCTSVGFIPMRSNKPMNLVTNPTLPALEPITQLGTGVLIGVR
jgi:hypothetical protein